MSSKPRSRHRERDAATYDPKNGWNLSFGGCGFLGFYHIGVTQCLSDRAPHLLQNARMFFGASSGSLHCVTFVAGVPVAQILKVLTALVRKVRNQSLGPLQPTFNLNEYFRDALQKYLPENVHEIISGRVGLSLTRLCDGKNVVVSDFRSKDEVVDAVLCSCYIPYVSGILPPSFRGVRYLDGGFTNSIPFFDTKTTITVSPFYGEFDICPKAKCTSFFHLDVSRLSIRFCLQNFHLFWQMLFPPDVKALGEICLRGYLDTAQFLEKNGLCDRPPTPCPSLSSEELEAPELPRETRSLEVPPEGAGCQTRLERELTTALSEAGQARGGCMSKIRSSLPAKALTCAMLPCTLPAQTAVAAAHRLVTWLPEVPEHAQWLQSMARQACSRVTTRLFPACR